MNIINYFKPSIGNKEARAAYTVVKSGNLSSGKITRKFENLFLKKLRTKSKKSIAVSNCTSALYTVLNSLNIKEGDEVICPSLSFVADASTIKMLKAKPVFCDIVSEDNLNQDISDLEKKITNKTKAIIIMYYAGYPCNLDYLSQLRKKYKIPIIEDACHALFSYEKKRYLGTIFDYGVFSFYANKNMTTGEGGMIICNKKKFDFLKSFREHSIVDRNYNKLNYKVNELGFNFRLDEIRSCIGIQQLDNILINNQIRKKIALYYLKNLKKYLPSIKIPFENMIGKKYSYHLFPILLPRKTSRQKFVRYLKKNGIFVSMHYPPIHKFNFYLSKTPLNKTNDVSKRLISLPIYPKLKKKEINKIIEVIKNFFQ